MSLARSRRPRHGGCALAAAGALTLLACSPEPAVGVPLAPARGGTGTWTALAQQLFVPRCASTSCHGGHPPAYFPEIDATGGYDALVNVPSQQAVMNLVEPGAPDQSWLLVRLRGTAGGAAMPLGDTRFSDAEIAAVESWIANGAPR